MVGEADAAVGGGVAGEVAGVHADGSVEAEEVEHGGADKFLTRTGAVLAGVGIAVDDFAGFDVFDDAVERGAVVDVFFSDLEAAGWCPVGGGSAGDGGDADELFALVEVGFLLGTVDADGGGAFDAVAVPVAAFVRVVGVLGRVGFGSVVVAQVVGAATALSGREGRAGGKEDGQGEKKKESFHFESRGGMKRVKGRLTMGRRR